MTTIAADTLSPPELAALLHFYAEAGVDWLLEDEPIDRFAEFTALSAARAAPARAPSNAQQPRMAPRGATTNPRPPAAGFSGNSVPDAESMAEAAALAASASSMAELVDIVAAFNGCNLRNTARFTVFAGDNLTADTVVVGGLPGADDDREGMPFAGLSGALLGKMLAGIGMSRQAVATISLIPWRTPGDRSPTAHEIGQCLPFGLRALELMAPKRVLALGNLSARLLSGDPRAGIHTMRGKPFELVAGPRKIPAMVTFHPQELMAAPASKRQAWQDLLTFAAEL